MRKTPLAAAFGGVLFAFYLAGAPRVGARERDSIDWGWRFIKADGADFAAPQYDDSGWQRVDLPHDWGIAGPFDPKGDGATARLPYWGVGWYRRHLSLHAAQPGERFYLQIDGAMSYSTVWLNGRKVGGWPYGYTSYELDLTPFADVHGDNVLAIRLDNPPESSRWYPGGGIYRHVWLLRTGPIHVGHWGTYVTTPRITAQQASVVLRTTLEDDGTPADAEVRTVIYDLDSFGRHEGPVVCEAPPARVRLSPGSPSVVSQDLFVPRPRLWSLRSRNRYVAVTQVSVRSAIVDTYETPFGIRSLTFDPRRGFLLNGEPLRIQGVCDHHDLGAIGTAVNERALERQLTELKEMGCNAIRTSHNPPAPELLDLCDRMGFVVMDEAFDCWTIPKRPNDYHLLFPEWHDRDLRAMIERDRNHPSVIMWSIGNEIPEQEYPALGVKIGSELVRLVHAEDPTRPVTSACNYPQSGFDGFGAMLDVVGYNYQWMHYAEFRRAHPNVFLYGSETASTISSRGCYAFPVSDDKLQGLLPKIHQVSSYDLSAPYWAWPPDDEFRAEDDNPGVGGEFVWTGWDYLGEPTPYGSADDPSRSSYFGIIDLAGFKKDRFYLYQSRWRPDLPMAHLVPHWTWPDRVGKVTPVFVYTTGDEAELFLNGKSLGRHRREPGEYRFRWNQVVYRPGELKVIAYRKGMHWAEAEERTAGAPAQLHAEADRTRVAADGRDLVYVSVLITDADGTPQPRAINWVHFAVTGPGDLIATDNGDATCLASFQRPDRTAFNGRLLAIIRPRRGAPGQIVVRATAAGLSSASVVIMSHAP